MSQFNAAAAAAAATSGCCSLMALCFYEATRRPDRWRPAGLQDFSTGRQSAVNCLKPEADQFRVQLRSQKMRPARQGVKMSVVKINYTVEQMILFISIKPVRGLQVRGLTAQLN